jgi:hypothetical protein
MIPENVEVKAHFNEDEYLILTIEGEQVRKTRVISGNSYEFRYDGEQCNFVYFEKHPYGTLDLYPINMFNPRTIKLPLLKTDT